MAVSNVARNGQGVKVTMLIGLQIINAWFFAAVAVGLTLFQELIPRPGLASGLYVNTRRVGAIVSGPIITIGSATRLGYGGVFLTCAVITMAALLTLASAGRSLQPYPAVPGGAAGSGGSGFGDRPAEGLQGDDGGLGAAALAGVEAVDRGELLGRELEVEHVDVLRDPRRLG